MMTNERLNLADLKAEEPRRPSVDGRGTRDRECLDHAQGRDDVLDPASEYAEEGYEIGGDGVLEVLQDGFGFLAQPRRPTICPVPTTSTSAPI
jgi:transcription termination factor Rho